MINPLVAKLVLPVGGGACFKETLPAKEHFVQLRAHLWKRWGCCKGPLPASFMESNGRGEGQCNACLALYIG